MKCIFLDDIILKRNGWFSDAAGFQMRSDLLLADPDNNQLVAAD